MSKKNVSVVVVKSVEELKAEITALNLALSVSKSNQKADVNRASVCFVKKAREEYLVKNLNATMSYFEKNHAHLINVYAKEILKSSDEKLTLDEFNKYLSSLY